MKEIKNSLKTSKNQDSEKIFRLMRKSVVFAFLTFIVALSAFGQPYIQNVTVIDVENQKLLSGQTVVVKDGIISEVADFNKIKPATGATVIDGNGKFLMPGMTDSHVHFFQSGGLYARPDVIDLRKYQPYDKEIAWTHDNMEDFLRRYLKAGITTVIDVGSTYNFLNQRKSFADKDFAPKIYMTGPLLTSYLPAPYKDLKNDSPFNLVTNIEEAKKAIDEQMPYKPDFIKVWYIVDSKNVEESARKFEPVFRAIVEETHRRNLKVAVHATQKFTAEIAVRNGADYLVHSVEDAPVSDEFVQMMKKNKTVLCPTLTVYQGYTDTLGQTTEFSSYDLMTANPLQIGTITDLKHLPEQTLIERYKTATNSKANIEQKKKQDATMRANLKKLATAGVTIAAGTDAGNIGTHHASSFIKELEAMKASGLTNWQVLQSATLNPAKIFDAENKTGSIAVGKKADLILLDANPVEALENLKKINLIFNNGKPFNPADLIIETAESLAQKQLNAYNARNLDAFLEPYADDVELYEFPNKLLYKGKETMRKQYGEMFAKFPELHCEIKGRIVQGDTVIDRESVSGFGQNKIEATAIYQIKQGKIAEVYFIR